MVWTSKDGPKCPVSREDRGEFMEPAPALFEIRETKKYSFDVLDMRLAAPVWVASFRLFRDAKEYADSQIALSLSRPDREAGR